MLHVGVRKPKILFIGDYPSEAECAGASPFSTPAGEMLFKMGTAMGLAWENAPQGRGVAFVNVLKCRPETMTPTAESLSVCGLYLRRQIELAEPAALVLLGHLPVKVLSIMGNASFSSIEGKILDCRGIVAMPIKHPNAIMRFVNQKSIFFDERKKAWTALQQLMKMVF